MNSGEDESDLQRKTKIKGILIFKRKLNQKISSANFKKKGKRGKKRRLGNILTLEFKLNCKFQSAQNLIKILD